METKSKQVINYTHPLYMNMFTDEGNIQVHNMVNIIILEATRGEFSRTELRSVLDESMSVLNKSGYSEVYDTEVRMSIAARLNRELLIPMKWVEINYFFDDLEA